MKALHTQLDFLEVIVHAIESYAADLRGGMQVGCRCPCDAMLELTGPI